MLVLTRKIGESITIAGNIVVTVVETRGERVRLGVTAPDDVRVDRAEVAAERAEAAASGAPPPRSPAARSCVAPRR